MAPRWSLALTLCFVSAPALADVVHLVDGGQLSGAARIVGQEVAVTTSLGEVRVARSEVARIEKADTALDTYAARRATLGVEDVEEHRGLARWAEAHELSAQAAEQWRAVLRVRPDDPEARARLGYVRYEGRWLTEAEHQRALGRVRYAGAWVEPERAESERAALQAMTEARVAKARQDAEARARAEAEARASAPATAEATSTVGWGFLAPLPSAAGYPPALVRYTLTGWPPLAPGGITPRPAPRSARPAAGAPAPTAAPSPPPPRPRSRAVFTR